MAEEYVGKDQFNEFVKRMEQGFHHADQRHTELLAIIDQRFTQVDQRFEQVNQRFEQVNQRFEQVNQQMTLAREAMLLRFEQADRQRAEDRQAMMEQFEQVNHQFEQVDRQFGRHETRLLSLENWMRTTYVTLAIVVVGVAAQLFYTLLKFGFKPTP